MAIIDTVNYGSITYSSGTMQWATQDSDIFNRTHVSNTAQAVEQHDHSSGKGLGVARLSTTNTLTNPGDVHIGSSQMQYKDSGGSTHTLAALDTNNNFSGTVDASTITSSNGFKVPVIAGANPTQSGSIAYDSTANTFKVGINGSDATILTTGGGAVSVSQGGTGRTSLTAHTVLIGEGTSAVNQIGPGTAAYPLVAVSSADPAFQQLTGSGIAASTITGSNIASATITGSNIASGTITGSNIATGTAVPLDHGTTTGSATVSTGTTTIGSMTVPASAVIQVQYMLTAQNSGSPSLSGGTMAIADAGGDHCISFSWAANGSGATENKGTLIAQYSTGANTSVNVRLTNGSGSGSMTWNYTGTWIRIS